MMNIISSEFYKIFRSKIFFAVSTIMLVMNVFFFGLSVYQKNSVSVSHDVKEMVSGSGVAGYQGSYGGDFIFYIILIFVVSMITAEYANGSIRQMACHGIARWKLVVGQYIAMSSVITIILIGFGAINLLSDTILYKFGEVNAAAFIRMNLGILCVFWGTAGVGTFLSYLLKNVGITIIISILLVTSSNFVVGMLTLLTKNEALGKYTLTNMRNAIINFASKPEETLKYSILFLFVGIVGVLGSSLLFSKRDVD